MYYSDHFVSNDVFFDQVTVLANSNFKLFVYFDKKLISLSDEDS